MILGIITIILIVNVIFFLIISFWINIFKEAPFSPTPFPAVHKVLKHANIKKGDKIYDIGAGDGRFLHFASKNYGAKTTGFEMNPFIYFLAKLKQFFLKWEGKIIYGNFLQQNFKDADIIICYLLPKTFQKYEKFFKKELKTGTKIISYAFKINNWTPKKIVPKENKISKIYIYKV